MGNFQYLKNLVDASLQVRHAIDLPEDFQVLPDAQVSRQLGVGAAEIRAAQDLDPVGHQFLTEYRDVAACGRDNAEHHVDYGSFAGTISPQQSKNLAVGNIKRNPVHRSDVAELLRQISDL